MAIKWKAMTTTTTTAQEQKTNQKYVGSYFRAVYLQKACFARRFSFNTSNARLAQPYNIQLSTKIRARREREFSIFLELLFFYWKMCCRCSLLAGSCLISAANEHVFSFNYFVRHGFTRHINKIHEFSSTNYTRTELPNYKHFVRKHIPRVVDARARRIMCVQNMSSLCGYF